MIFPHRKLIKPPVGQRPYRGHRLSKGLVGDWGMPEGAGNTVADLSGNGKTGTFVNTPRWIAGKFGHAIYLDAADHDYINLGTTDLVGSGVAFSYSFSFFAPIGLATGSYTLFGQRYSGSNAYSVRIYWYNPSTSNLLRFVCRNSLGTTVYCDVKPVLGVWNHVVGTYDGVNLRHYLNGVLKDTDALAGPLQTGVVHTAIGALPATTPMSFWEGIISDFSAYNRDLSASEIALLHREPFCMFYNENQFGILGSYTTPVGGNAGIMTCNTGYWGSI